MSWIILNWFLVFGLVPAQNEYVDYKAATLSTEAIATVAQLGAEVILWDRLSFFGDIENFQYFKGNSELIAGAFIPYRVDYSFGTAFKLNQWVSLEATHECDHIVQSKFDNSYQSAETKLSIRFQGTSWFYE